VIDQRSEHEDKKVQVQCKENIENTRVGSLMVRVETVAPEKLQSRKMTESRLTMVLPAEGEDSPPNELELQT
jgi:hypothetical protein